MNVKPTYFPSVAASGFFAVLLSLVASVSSAAKPSPSPVATSSAKTSSEKVRIALNWKPEPQFGGFYAAQTGDIGKKYGIDFDVVPGGAGTPVIQMIAAGQFDFGIASADEVVVSRARGTDVVALFAVFQTNPQGVLTHAERGFESLADVFRNAGTIAMQKGLPYAVFLQRKYASGMKASIVPYLGGISNFLSRADHSQQCFVMSEPLLARQQNAKTKTFLVAESGFNPYMTVLVTRRSLLKDKPELVKNVVMAVRDGWRQYLDHPEDANKKIRELNPSFDMKALREIADAQKALIETEKALGKGLALGSMTESRWLELSEQLQSMKVIVQRPVASDVFVKF